MIAIHIPCRVSGGWGIWTARAALHPPNHTVPDRWRRAQPDLQLCSGGEEQRRGGCGGRAYALGADRIMLL